MPPEEVKTAKPANSIKPEVREVKPAGRNAPPLSIDATLQLAWGLTMSFSHEPTQNEVGKVLMDWFKTLGTNCGKDRHAQVYVDNLSAIISSYLRTSAFEREVFVGYLDTYKNLRESNTKNVNDIADVASLSSGSILTKLAAFLGFGSLAEIIGIITNLASPTLGLPFNLNFVLFGGFGGLLATVILFRLSRGKLIQRAERQSYEKQLTFWSSKAKPCFMKELFFLRSRLKSLVETFYEGYTEGVLDWDDKSLKKYFAGTTSSLEKNDLLTKYFDDMLPDENLYEITKKK